MRNYLNSKEVKELNKIEKNFEQQQKKNLLIEKKISKFFVQKLKFFKYGVFELKIEDLQEYSSELQLEILKKILSTCASKNSIPRRDSLLTFLKKVQKNTLLTHTLHSCVIKISKKKMKIYKEITNKFEENYCDLKKGEKILWQERFEVESTKTNIEIKNINQQNWQKLKVYFSFEKSKLNFLILQTLPLIIVNRKFIIPFLSPESDLKKYGINFFFKPITPLLKKNFF